jgi:hypothetical protein
MIDLADPATSQFLHSGCALQICTVEPDGRPHAGRAWGLTVVDAEAGLIRLLVEADDAVTVTNLRDGRAMSLTATNVTNFHSMQLKGRGLTIDVPTEADEAKHAQYTNAFLMDVHHSNGYAMELMQRWAGRPVVPGLVTVDSSFDQTPGPSAGAATDRGSP